MSRLDLLTEKERDLVTALVYTGSPKAAYQHMGIGQFNAAARMQRVHRKLDLQTAAEVTAYAMANDADMLATARSRYTD